MDNTPFDCDIAVLGAGVIGINTAYWALRAGKSVCVIDRQPIAGIETSYANGGQISVSHAEPWANPGTPLKALKWLFDKDAPLLFRPRLDVHQWLWLAKFAVECLPSRADRNTIEIVKLATESRALLGEIRERENIRYDQRMLGILHFYRDAKEYKSAVRVAELMGRYGCERNVIDREEVVRLEPAFAEHKEKIVGATYTAADESGDAKKYTQELAAVCARSNNARFLYGSEVVALEADRRGGTVAGIEVATPEGFRRVRARDVILSLGSYSAPFLRKYGVDLAIYPAKGYSVTVPIEPGSVTPQISLTDDQYKLVYSNLGDRLRIAGTAELSGYSRALNLGRCEAIRRNVRTLFPRAGAFDKAQFWSGLRPATPSNVPYVGRTKYRNLWLNTGHGTLGWTMGAGSGKRIVDMVTAAEGPVVA